MSIILSMSIIHIMSSWEDSIRLRFHGQPMKNNILKRFSLLNGLNSSDDSIHCENNDKFSMWILSVNGIKDYDAGGRSISEG